MLRYLEQKKKKKNSALIKLRLILWGNEIVFSKKKNNDNIYTGKNF